MGFSLLHGVAVARGWYYAHPWIDIPMHLGGGAFVAWVAIALRRRFPDAARLPLLVQAVLVLALVALVGVGWELLEAAVDAWIIRASGVPLRDIPAAFGAFPYDKRWDTLLDLCNDLIGGGAAALAWLGCRVASREESGD